MTPISPSGRWRRTSLLPFTITEDDLTCSSARYSSAFLAQKPKALAP